MLLWGDGTTASINMQQQHIKAAYICLSILKAQVLSQHPKWAQLDFRDEERVNANAVALHQDAFPRIRGGWWCADG